MTRTLQRIGNSKGVVLTKTMLDHLGVTDTVEVTLEAGRVILAAPKDPVAGKPMSFEDAMNSTMTQYAPTMARLADASHTDEAK